MAFTTRTVTHQFNNADGTAASGTIVFTLTGRMTNGSISMMPSSKVTATLNGSGQLSVSLEANDDAATTPTGVLWQVTIEVAGSARTEQYFVNVPSAGSGNVDLMSLVPQASHVE